MAGVCGAAETATETDGTHPTGKHSSSSITVFLQHRLETLNSGFG